MQKLLKTKTPISLRICTGWSEPSLTYPRQDCHSQRKKKSTFVYKVLYAVWSTSCPKIDISILFLDMVTACSKVCPPTILGRLK